MLAAQPRGRARPPQARRPLEIAQSRRPRLVLIVPQGRARRCLRARSGHLLPSTTTRPASNVRASVAGAGPSAASSGAGRTGRPTTGVVRALVGAARMAPGEVTLAHHGVLFLDELPVFDRASLRRSAAARGGPGERGPVGPGGGLNGPHPARRGENPCPAAGTAPCRSLPLHGRRPGRYRGRISGPLRDRIDLWVPVPRLAPRELLRAAEPEPSATVAARVAAGRARQVERRGCLNGLLSGRALRAAARLDRSAERRATALAERAGMTARATERLVRVARTIADLAAAEGVGVEHLEEAARYRPPAADRAGRLRAPDVLGVGRGGPLGPFGARRRRRPRLVDRRRRAAGGDA